MASAKVIFSLMGIFMAVYVCQFSALPYNDEEAALIHELEDAPLEDVDLSDLFDDSDEIGARSNADVMDILKDKCSCEGLTCGCCAKPRISGFQFTACANMTMFPNDKVIEVGFGAGDQGMKRNITVGQMDPVCNNLSGWLKKIKVCLHNTWTESEDRMSTAACSSVDILVFNKTVATIKFQCLELKDNKLEFVNHPDVKRFSLLSFKMKNPVKGLFNFFMKNKEEE